MKMNFFLKIVVLAVTVFLTQSSFAGSGDLYCAGGPRTATVYVNTAYWTGTITVHAQDSYSWATGSITGTSNTWSLSCNIGPCTKTQTKVGVGKKNLTLNCNSVSADANDSYVKIKVTW